MTLIDQLTEASAKSRRVVEAILRYSRPNDVDDALQNALLKAWLALTAQRFEGRAQLSTWFTRIAINEALMLKRRECGQQEEGAREFFSLDEAFGVENGGGSPEELALEAERAQLLYEAISKLKRRRKLAALNWLAGESARGAEKAARHKAKVQLREMLS